MAEQASEHNNIYLGEPIQGRNISQEQANVQEYLWYVPMKSSVHPFPVIIGPFRSEVLAMNAYITLRAFLLQLATNPKPLSNVLSIDLYDVIERHHATKNERG